MSKTPLVNTRGRASCEMRAASSSGGQILVSTAGAGYMMVARRFPLKCNRSAVPAQRVRRSALSRGGFLAEAVQVLCRLKARPKNGCGMLAMPSRPVISCRNRSDGRTRRDPSVEVFKHPHYALHAAGGARNFGRVVGFPPRYQPEQIYGACLGDDFDMNRVEFLGIDKSGFDLGGEIRIVGARRKRTVTGDPDFVVHAAHVLHGTRN